MRSTTRRFPRSAILLCLVISCTTAIALAQATANQLAALNELTQSLITLSHRTPGEQSSARDLARQRHDLLLTLAATSPGAVPQFFLPSGVAEKLPSSAQPYLETDADETGMLQTVVEDYAGSHKLRFFLDTGTEKLEVYFVAGAPPHLLSGSRIRGRGKRFDNVLLLGSAPTAGLGPEAVQVLALATPDTFGAQSTAVLLLNFIDNTSTPFTLADVRNVVFTTVSNFDLENSQNQTWLTGDVFGWITLPISVTTCPNVPQFIAAAQQAAATAGLDLSSYNRFVYIFPHDACLWRGEATLGGTPSHAFINGSDVLQVIGHEMGHNFGLYHSHSLDCGGTTLGTNCQVVEYGDLFDIMGDVTASHFNAFQKEQLGWLNYGISQPITTVTAGGVYTVTPYEAGTGVKALKVLQSTDASTGLHTWYYVEYRQLIGFDAPLDAYPSSTTGVLIHSASEADPNSSLLLNMHPQGGFENAALGVGESFVDAKAGVSITTKSADASGATVDIEFGPGGCHAASPLITVSPAQAPPVLAGSTQTFTISVTNGDTAGCSGSTFILGAVVPTTPAGWTMTINPSSFVLAPQASATAILQVTSPSTTPVGNYPITVSATEWPNFTYTASTTATYVVTTAPPPDFTLVAPASVTVLQGSSAPISVTSTVKNGFSAPVSLSISGLPTGVTGGFSPSAFAAPGAGTSTLTFSATASAAVGSYTVTITASGGGITHSVTVQMSVTNTPVPPPPVSYTLFSPSAVPANSLSIGTALELGMKFTADSSGSITGIRFYKAPNDPGPHVGSVWTASGQKLASVTFSNETSSGWQQANFSTPVAISANTLYVVSYSTPYGTFSYTDDFFNSAVSNPPLHAPASATVNGNGVYEYGVGSFPTGSNFARNYWVDVVFSPLADFTLGAPASVTVPQGSSVPISVTSTVSSGFFAPVSLSISGLPTGVTAVFSPSTFPAPGSGTSTLTFTAAASAAAGSYAVTITASGGGITHSVTVQMSVTGAPPSLISISVTPASPLLSVGTTQQFTATGHYSDGTTQDLTSQAAWSSSSTTVATISTSGLATAANAGTTIITAAQNGISGSTPLTVISTPPPPVNYTLFSPSAVPANSLSIGLGLELGMKFTSDSSGSITGIRFYKAPNDPGPHVGSLWTASGQKLGSVTFSNETSSGWQEADFPAPVAISANTLYVVSYSSPFGAFSYTDNFFNSSVDNAPLHAPASTTVNGNGVYEYGTGVFPTGSNFGRNYWVDVVLTVAPNFTLGAPANVTVPQGGSAPISVTSTVSNGFSAPVALSISGLPTGVTAVFSPSTLAAPGSGTSTLTFSATASAAAGSYTVTITGSGGGITHTVAVQMSVTGTPPPSASHTLFSPSAVPANSLSIGTALELGMKFTADSNGSITGIRFYKAPNDPGPHVGSVWTASGQKLASLTFSSETSSGWQQANFSTPVAISANTLYVVSYSTPYGAFSYTDGFFNSAVDNPPLHAPASATVNGNGVYAYGAGVFPTGSNFARNYWVDVVFTQ